MKKYSLVVIAFICITTQYAFAQVNTPIVNIETKNESGQQMLLGHCSISAFKKEPFVQWFNTNFDAYTLDSVAILQLKPLIKKMKVDLFMGTWCGDSKREVPRMIKVLLAAGFDTSNLSIIAVGNNAEMYKKSPQGEEVGLNIRRVPTLIFYEKKKEIGRFIEYPVVSLEKDLLRILLKDGYVPNYADLKE
jgi:thiol-disulfide isomerase/thioredoxin